MVGLRVPYPTITIGYPSVIVNVNAEYLLAILGWNIESIVPVVFFVSVSDIDTTHISHLHLVANSLVVDIHRQLAIIL